MKRGEGTDDAALRAAFAELREAEEAGAPPLARVLGPVRGPRARLLRPAWAATVAVVLGVTVLVLTLGDGGGRRGPIRTEPSLADWVAPTDFLLETPGIELLRSTPQIPEPALTTMLPSSTEPSPGDPR